MRVVVTRPAPECGGWVAQLGAAGFDAIALPLIDIRPAPGGEALAHAWQGLGSRRAAMFVSANAVRGFFAGRPGQAWPGTVRAWATGSGTRQALLDAGVPPASIDVPPDDSPLFDSEALWQVAGAQVRAGDSVLVVRGGDAATGEPVGRDWLAERVAAAGAQVVIVVAYLRGCPVWSAAQVELAKSSSSGVWLFSSSQAIAHLQALVPRQDWSQARAVATHPRIAQAAREASFGVVCESRPSVTEVVAALESLR